MPIVTPSRFCCSQSSTRPIVAASDQGIASAVVSLLYARHYLAEPGFILRYTPENAYTLLGFLLVFPFTVLLVGRMRDAAERARGVELSRAEAERLDRRLSFFAEANLILAASLDHEATLRNLARLSVPTLADWCAIHIANEHGQLQFVTAAHRDPAKDLLVRALCESGSQRPPLRRSDGGSYGAVTDECFGPTLKDAEQLKLLRVLAPRSFIRVPLLARGHTAGMLTLVAGPESGRVYGPDDLSFAQELAGRAVLVGENGRLQRHSEEANERYGMLFGSNPQPMWVFDSDTLAFLDVNDAAIRHYGYSRDELLSMTIMDILPPDDAPGVHHGLERTGTAPGRRGPDPAPTEGREALSTWSWYPMRWIGTVAGPPGAGHRHQRAHPNPRRIAPE